MISPKWLITIILLILGLSFVNGMIEQAYMGNVEGKLAVLMSTDEEVDFGVKLSSLWGMMTFDYPQFKNADGSANPLTAIRYVFMAISMAILFSISLTILSSLTSLASRFFRVG